MKELKAKTPHGLKRKLDRYYGRDMYEYFCKRATWEWDHYAIKVSL